MPDFLNTLGVKTWLRYRDDILVVGNIDGAKELLRRFKLLIKGVWKAKVEDVSSWQVEFLDLTIFKFKNRTGRHSLAWRPYTKPTKVFSPLLHDSAHMHFVHSWPIAECRRLARNSNSNSIFQLSLLNYIHDLVRQRLRGDIIAQCCELASLWHDLKQVGLKVRPPTQVASCGCSLSGGERTFTLVVPYHPVWHKANFAAILQDSSALFHLEFKHLSRTQASEWHGSLHRLRFQ